jgi:predicted DsbA family dithiol-disulfide isomerase
LGHSAANTLLNLAALAEEEPGSVLVRWHAFQLQPDLPPEGVDAERYFAAKFGGPERVHAIHERVSGVARDVGLDLRFDRQKRAPNTLLAHRAVKLAGDSEQAIETLFAAHFVEGEDIGDPDTVLRLLPDVDPAALDRGEGTRSVDDDLEVAEQIGVTGVPFFVAGGRVAVSGAHEPELLRKVIAAGREQAAA